MKVSESYVSLLFFWHIAVEYIDIILVIPIDICRDDCHVDRKTMFIYPSIDQMTPGIISHAKISELLIKITVNKT